MAAAATPPTQLHIARCCVSIDQLLIGTSRANSIEFKVNPRVHAKFEEQAKAEAVRRNKVRDIYAKMGEG